MSPVFFLASGIRLNLGKVIVDPAALLLVPLVFGLLPFVPECAGMGVALPPQHPPDGRRGASAGDVVAVSPRRGGEIGESTGVLGANQGGALALAGPLSVIILRTTGLILARSRIPAPVASA